MRLRYHELVGKTVIDSQGKRAGKVMDLRAFADGDAFRVTALLIGPPAFLERLGLAWRRRAGDTAINEVPWSAVERIAGQVYLRVPAAPIGPVPRLAEEPK